MPPLSPQMTMDSSIVNTQRLQILRLQFSEADEKKIKTFQTKTLEKNKSKIMNIILIFNYSDSFYNNNKFPTLKKNDSSSARLTYFFDP